MSASGDRAAELLEAMTRDEKLAMVHGATDPTERAAGYLPGVPRLDVHELRLVDGPLGVRIDGARTTAFPAALAGAATFDPGLVRHQGAAMAREVRSFGMDVLLAPGLNLIRVPQCGRNFEYYSEDPLLTGRCAAAAVEGIQSAGVIATPKHYVANNQETARARYRADVDERVLRELYLPGFHDAVDAGALAVMTAYNRVNSQYMSEHAAIVGGILKDEWGFPGFVMSDWYGTMSTVGAAKAGLDLEMPGVSPDRPEDADEQAKADPPPGMLRPFHEGMPETVESGFFGRALAEAIDRGDISADRLDDMVERILSAMERIGRLDGDDPSMAVDWDEHGELATTIAARGTVLLENDDILPLAETTDVAVIGPNVDAVTLGGGGSSEVEPRAPVATAAGIRARAEGNVTVARGGPRIRTPSMFDLMRGRGVIGAAEEGPSREAAIRAAGEADVAVVVVRDWRSEGLDRADLRLPGQQDELVSMIADANDRTVVVLQTGGPVETPWRDEVAAILQAWYPGQADGAALARVLYGDVDASGRLPVTFARTDAYPTSDETRFPGKDEWVAYEEGMGVGYRYFDRAEVDHLYPFGHGRSYADFAFRDTVATGPRRIQAEVENTSGRDGHAVLQAYVEPPDSSVDRPLRALGGFAGVDVVAGGTRTVSLDLDERAFSHWDDGWVPPNGTYTVRVGRSATDLPLATEIERTKDGAT